MKMLLKFKFSVLLLCIAGNSLAAEYTFRQTREFKKAFKVSEGVSVDVSNKYGQIIFTNWNKDSVLFKVEVVSEGDKLERVMENLDEVDISFTGNKVYVEARTEWRENQNFFQKSVNDIRRNLSGSTKLEINYQIYLPQGTNINVENRFGDVYLTDVEGVLNADISHGNLRGGNLKKIRKLKLRYGDIRLNSVDFATIDAGYGDLEIGDSRELNLTTNSADVVLGKVKDLNLVSKNDHFDIETVEEINGSLVVTDLKINKLITKADINSKLGSVRLRSISSEFTRLNLTGSYSNYTIITDGGMNTSFKVTMENSDNFIYPKSVKIESHDVVDKTNTYRGKIGNGGDNKIIISNKNGQVRFEI